MEENGNSVSVIMKKDIKSTKKSPHTGHRQRVIKKFMEHGLDSFAEHEVLELILFFAIPRADTNAIAHRIIDEFGSLQNVFDASAEDLTQIEGVGNNCATLISLFRAVSEYKNKLYKKNIVLPDVADYGVFCKEYFADHVDESAIMLAFDSYHRLKKVAVISTGTFKETALYAEKIMKIALTLRAPIVVIAHNHPGGKLTPSTADKILTKRLQELLQAVHIKLEDHIICNETDFTSMFERGFLDDQGGI